MRSRQIARAALLIALTAIIYAVDRVTGLTPDLTALYLVPVVLSTLWFGTPFGLIAVCVALLAQVLAHPIAHRPEVLADAATHFAVFVFAVAVTARLQSQLEQIRALNLSRDYEIRVARQLQEAVAEYASPSDPRFDVASRLRAARDLGGDFSMVRETPNGLFVCVSDIAGKGISAALFTALLQSSLAAALEDTDDPSAVVRIVNERMYLALPPEMFVTALCCLFSDTQVTYANAGHEPGLLLRAGDSAARELVSPSGLPLGVEPALTIDERSEPFEPGDSFLAFTDGVSDAPGFGGDRDAVRRLFESVSVAATTPDAAAVASAVFGAALEGQESLRDDITVVAIRRVDASN